MAYNNNHINLLLKTLKTAVSFVKELEGALTSINYTLDVSSSRLEDIGNSSIDTARQLKTSARNVLSAVTAYANANETADSILNKSRPAIMLSNVTGMDTAAAANILQDAINQFDLDDSAESLMHVSDVLQTVSQSVSTDFGRGIEEIADGIRVSGAAAKDAGYGLEEYSALLGKLIESTHQGGNELGQSLKSMFVRLSEASAPALADGVISEEDVANAEKALGRVGIAVRDNTDSFRNFDDIMADLNNRIDTLSGSDLSGIAQGAASMGQTDTFQVMVKTWADYLSLAEQAGSASNTTLINQEKYAESLAGTFGELTAQTQEFYNTVLDDSALKNIINTGTNFLSLITSATDKIGIFTTIATGLGTILGAKNLGYANTKI